MKTSIATVSISAELPEKLEAIANAGFDVVEVFETSAAWSATSKACRTRTAHSATFAEGFFFEIVQRDGIGDMVRLMPSSASQP